MTENLPPPAGDKYQRIADVLYYLPVGHKHRGKQPIALIKELYDGGDDQSDDDGRTSFRAIAAEIEAITHVPVTYESVRRWYRTSYPDAPQRRSREPLNRVAPSAIPPATFQAPPSDEAA